MGLTQYNQKRNFKKTAEPEGKAKRSKGRLRFVVQKHDASHVHYDFRLELHGVLKSWAIPKGPSLNPADKRLAVMVEDHPYDYRNFEGVIPQGEYGGGTVIVWDEGSYYPVGAETASRQQQETILRQQWQNGALHVVLQGEKLRGEFRLFRMKGRGEKNWILAKKKDEWSSDTEVTLNEVSAKSGKTLADIAQAHGATLNHPDKAKPEKGEKKRAEKEKIKNPARKKSKQTSPSKAAEKFDNHTAVRRTALPATIVPMMATLIDEAFDSPDWIFEIKWDGYRATAHCNGKKTTLVSRNGKSFTQKYSPVSQALPDLGLKAVLDGEIVAIDENGLANFQLLQNWQNTPVHLHYQVFDLLWLDGYDLTHLPLVERKKRLQQLLPSSQNIIRYSDHVVGKGKAFFKAAQMQGLEGIMAKRAGSLYQPGVRTPDWVKIKVALRQEVIIAGYTEPRRSRKFFGSLLLGVYEAGSLVYVGHTGSGFNTKTLEELYKKMQPLKTARPPFEHPPKTNMPATWIKLQLVCEIKFTEWTKERQARHAIFMGLREDKKATSVTFENSTTMAKIKTAAKKTAPKKAAARAAATGRTPKSRTSKTKTSGKQVDVETEPDQTILLDGHELPLTNLKKIY